MGNSRMHVMCQNCEEEYYWTDYYYVKRDSSIVSRYRGYCGGCYNNDWSGRTYVTNGPGIDMRCKKCNQAYYAIVGYKFSDSGHCNRYKGYCVSCYSKKH